MKGLRSANRPVRLHEGSSGWGGKFPPLIELDFTPLETGGGKENKKKFPCSEIRLSDTMVLLGNMTPLHNDVRDMVG